MFVYYIIQDSYDSVGFKDGVILMCLFHAVNLIITIFGIYSASKLLEKIASYFKEDSNSMNTNELNAIYWSTVLVCGIINIICLFLRIWSTITTKNTNLYGSFYINYELVLTMPLVPIIFLIETVSIWIIVKDFKLRDSVCCFTNRYVLRIIHTFAICHILWFLHNVGCGLLVAIFFIALAPAQTLAAISLIFFVIFCTICYVAFNIYYINKMRCCTKESCKIACKLFTLFILYLCIVITLVCLTLLFSELANNGLTSSGLGSVVLSLVAPTIVFIITLRLKHHLEKYFITPKLKDQYESVN